ncbi:MAG: response regulator [Elusimicrobia bacterium]|nr:response regulator [Elusimicrobiota bacterium]
MPITLKGMEPRAYDAADIQRLREELDRQRRFKREFLAALGHELRNALAALKGTLSLMRLPGLKDQRGLQEAAELQTDQMVLRVNEMLKAPDQAVRKRGEARPAAAFGTVGLRTPRPRLRLARAQRPMRILVVDDHDGVSLTLTHFLQHIGHEVFIARDGRSGIELALLHRPQAVLLDIGLPDMSGREVVRRLRGEDGFKDCLFLAVSGGAGDDEEKLSLAAGFDQHLVKPVDFEKLAAQLQAHAARL